MPNPAEEALQRNRRWPNSAVMAEVAEALDSVTP